MSLHVYITYFSHWEKKGDNLLILVFGGHQLHIKSATKSQYMKYVCNYLHCGRKSMIVIGLLF